MPEPIITDNVQQDAVEGQTEADIKPVADAEPTKEGVKEGETKAEDEGFKDDGLEPPTKTRMSPKDYIIKRKNEQIAKLKSNQQAEESEAEEDILPEDEERISKVVAKQLEPYTSRVQEAEDNKEISEFLSKNPELSKFEATVRRYMAHPSRKDMPIKSIFYEVAGDSLLKIGAERQKKADIEARNSQTGGGSARGAEGKKDYASMSPEEFEAEKNRVRRGE